MSISSEITRLNNAKASIKRSIENKGITVSDTKKLDEYSSLIDSIEAKKPEQSKSVTPTETVQNVTPDSGYVLNNVSVGAISNTYVGSGVTRKSAQTYTPGTSDQTIASGQYLSGNQTIKGDPNLVAGNIKSGTSIFGITGTHQGGSTPNLQSKSVTYSSNGTATVIPDSGYDGLISVDVTVDVSGGGGSGGSGSLDTCTVILKANVGDVYAYAASYNNNGVIDTICEDCNATTITIENVLCGSLMYVSAGGASIPSWITDGATRKFCMEESLRLFKITASPGGTATITYINND